MTHILYTSCEGLCMDCHVWTGHTMNRTSRGLPIPWVMKQRRIDEALVIHTQKRIGEKLNGDNDVKQRTSGTVLIGRK